MQKYFRGYCIVLVIIFSSSIQALSESTITIIATEAPQEAILEILESEIKPLSRLTSVISAIRQQNVRHSRMSPDQITALDQAWRQETKILKQPLINSILEKNISLELQSIRNSSNGLITEIIAVDNKGLNVGISDVTSDYWQGDEDKWQKTLLKGPEAVFVSEAGIDESTQQFQIQISVTVVDPETSLGIGSLTVGIDLDLLELYLEHGGFLQAYVNGNL